MSWDWFSQFRKLHRPILELQPRAEVWLSRTEGDEAAEERRVVVIVKRKPVTKGASTTASLRAEGLDVPRCCFKPALPNSWGLFFPNPIKLGDRVDWLALGLKTPVTIDEPRLLVLVVLMVVRLGPGLHGR
ncbi:hypothetical protein PPACK8108_LOCUS3677 [Phakopsora pachyrhizi]|uniref:HTH CENPB-type domain-containing protein n=1 Tax=Phakopsora pachyrhizi TaxID=170000 RepID=A0AAV0ALP5_PHAPC|nr:hypothetical protein PPACK8108_LOCUS3677 [Phakopsora pachyrhizi]